MHRFTFFLLSLLCISIAYGQKTGIQFTELAWKAALEKAEAEDKLVFLDAYTTWCGPCKMLARDVFPQKAVGDYFNAHFVNLKMDMERGPGPGIARKYNVQGYPTMLFLNGKGEEVHRIVGYRDADALVEAGEQARDSKRNLSGLKARYESGSKDPQLLKDLFLAKMEAYEDDYAVIGEKYLKTIKDWDTPEARVIISMIAPEGDRSVSNYVLDNADVFVKDFGKERTYTLIRNIILKYSFEEEGTSEAAAFEKMEALYQRALPDVADALVAGFKLSYYERLDDWDNYAASAIAYFKGFSSEDPHELNNVAWTFFERVRDRKQLKQAVKWAKRSVKLDTAFYNTDTLAALYYKLGKKGKARKAALKAIALAKASGDDYSVTETLLEKIAEL